MIRVKQKLNSSRGASILLALVLFLLCAMVSAVVVGSAMTNMQKVKNRREQQQVYYSVSSAARLLHDAMEQVSFVGSESVQTYGCTNVVVGGTDQFTLLTRRSTMQNIRPPRSRLRIPPRICRWQRYCRLVRKRCT